MQHKLGILGAGRVGSAIARTAIAAGYDVAIAASGPAADIELLTEFTIPGARALDAAGVTAHADLVIVAVPIHKHQSVDAELLRGKTVIDTMNYWQPIDGEIELFTASGRGSSEIVSDHFIGATVVKTLNHIGYHDLEIDARAPGHPERRALGIAGDDAAAVAAVSAMIERFGFDAVPTGALATGRALQPGTEIFGGRQSAAELEDAVTRFQQFATADAISGGGRIEITAGRGSSVETFPLFGYDLRDYDQLYAEKLDLLNTINNSPDENVTWSGSVRPNIDNLAVVPRPVMGKLPVWVATGGNAASSVRAGQAGLPVAYGIIGGEPHRFAPLADLYRRAAAQAGHTGDNIKVSVGALGLIAPTKQEALDRFYPGWHNLTVEMGKLRGWAPQPRHVFEAQTGELGGFYVGSPDEIAGRIASLHKHMGHTRHFLQMDVGGLPQEHFIESLTLLATEVKPRVQRLLNAK